MKVKLGERYRDAVSGFEGVATARFEYMNGCVRYQLERLDKDGKEVLELVFDEGRLERAGEPVTATGTSGGPRSSQDIPRR